MPAPTKNLGHPVTDMERRLVYGALTAHRMTASELRLQACIQFPRITEIMEQVCAEGWVVGSTRNQAVYYGILRQPACCMGGFVPAMAQQFMPATLRAKHAKSDGKRGPRKSRAKRKGAVAA